jgi:hypothetical protein
VMSSSGRSMGMANMFSGWFGMSSGAGFNGNLPVYNNLHSNHLILNKF